VDLIQIEIISGLILGLIAVGTLATKAFLSYYKNDATVHRYKSKRRSVLVGVAPGVSVTLPQWFRVANNFKHAMSLRYYGPTVVYNLPLNLWSSVDFIITDRSYPPNWVFPTDTHFFDSFKPVDTDYPDGSLESQK